MSEKIPPCLEGVSETLLMTLYVRARESQRPDAMISRSRDNLEKPENRVRAPKGAHLIFGDLLGTCTPFVKYRLSPGVNL
jgi:hypothetical protein